MDDQRFASKLRDALIFCMSYSGKCPPSDLVRGGVAKCWYGGGGGGVHLCPNEAAGPEPKSARLKGILNWKTQSFTTVFQ